MSTEKKNNKKYIPIIIAIIIGFVVAMIIMGIAIYFGYSAAYNLETPTHMVSLFGLNIYELTKANDIYNGTGIGINMGIICFICIVIAIIIEQLIIRLNQKKETAK